MNFLEAIAHQGLLQQALLVAVLCGLVCGMMGPLVVARQLSSAAGGIAHAVVGGMGLCAWMGWPVMAGAFAAAIVVAVILARSHVRHRGNEEARVQVLWSIGMALGLVFLALTPGYSVDLMSYLFGNLLLADDRAVVMTLVVTLGVGALLITRFRPIEALCFDEEFAQVIGLPVKALNLVLYLATALTVVVLIQSVGLILVISLMTIPALVAGAVARSLAQMIGLSVAMNALFAFLGLWVSYSFDLPSGPSIILCAALAYVLVQVMRGSRSALWMRRSP
jgi:zinc transport system permease protein